jgi:hypothetical protein
VALGLVAAPVEARAQAGTPGPPGLARECDAPRAEWIWCDDFESDRLRSYFEVDGAGGAFERVRGMGEEGSWGMRATYAPGQPNAGSLKLAFGVTPDPGHMRPVDAGTRRHRDVYWRLFVRTQPGWSGQGPAKFARAMVLATPGWAQAAIAHVWAAGEDAPYLQIDPVRGTDAAGAVRTTGYNDFANFTWLGAVPGRTRLFSATSADRWFCVEARMRLNDAGRANGVFELWVDDRLEARRADLDWVGAYSAHGINAIFFENYWDAGSPVAQSRFFDNVVVSTQRIGCGG